MKDNIRISPSNLNQFLMNYFLSPPSSPTPHGYEDFSRDAFDERMISSRGMRGPSPPGRRYAPY